MMDSFEWNKILGGVLGALLFIVALNILTDELMAPEKPTSGGMTVATSETPTSGTSNAPEAKPDWGTVLPAADAAAGEKIHQRCLQCHDFAKGGPNKIGPNLYGVVGNKRAHEPSFSYSGAMQSAGGTWGYDELDAFLTNPRAAIAGTKMTFAGLSKQQDRINLIAWLRTQSDSPLAIPAPKPEAAAPPAATGPDGEGPTTQTQTPQPGEKPQPTVPGAAPPSAPTGGVPPATPGPAEAKPATGTQPSGQTTPPPPAAQPATPPGH